MNMIQRPLLLCTIVTPLYVMFVWSDEHGTPREFLPVFWDTVFQHTSKESFFPLFRVCHFGKHCKWLHTVKAGLAGILPLVQTIHCLCVLELRTEQGCGVSHVANLFSALLYQCEQFCSRIFFPTFLRLIRLLEVLVWIKKCIDLIHWAWSCFQFRMQGLHCQASTAIQ